MRIKNSPLISSPAVGCSVRAAATLSLAALLCSAAPGSWNPTCDETRTGSYIFQNLNGSPATPVKIYLCQDVTCAAKSDFATVTGDTYSAPRAVAPLRPFFLLEHDAVGSPAHRIIAARHLALEGAYNFRDTGGLPTEDGHSIRWGQVFRSDALAQLSANDYARLNAIGISLVCDLRSRDERKTASTNWSNGSPVFVIAPVSESSDGAALEASQLSKMLSGNVTLEQGTQMFESFYVQMVFNSASKFGAVLRSIASTDGPAMFHCTGGRDRTGITAALLEHILGVPEQTIENDYLLSTKYLDERGPITAFLPRLDPAKARLVSQILELQPRYIQAVFSAIDQRYGSFDRYRRDALRLSDADVVALKARLLE